jgi:hypothetical protein
MWDSEYMKVFEDMKWERGSRKVKKPWLWLGKKIL